MLSITESHASVTHKISDESGKWVGNVTVTADGVYAEHMVPVLPGGEFYGQYAVCDRSGCTYSPTFDRQCNGVLWLADAEAMHGTALPAASAVPA